VSPEFSECGARCRDKAGTAHFADQPLSAAELIHGAACQRFVDGIVMGSGGPFNIDRSVAIALRQLRRDERSKQRTLSDRCSQAMAVIAAFAASWSQESGAGQIRGALSKGCRLGQRNREEHTPLKAMNARYDHLVPPLQRRQQQLRQYGRNLHSV
jgi:hypothetical protein